MLIVDCPASAESYVAMLLPCGHQSDITYVEGMWEGDRDHLRVTKKLSKTDMAEHMWDLQRLGYHRTSYVEPFYVLFCFLFVSLHFKFPANSVVQQNAATLFHCEAPAMF